jgi:hypothetical protein
MYSLLFLLFSSASHLSQCQDRVEIRLFFLNCSASRAAGQATTRCEWQRHTTAAEAHAYRDKQCRLVWSGTVNMQQTIEGFAAAVIAWAADPNGGAFGIPPKHASPSAMGQQGMLVLVQLLVPRIGRMIRLLVP